MDVQAVGAILIVSVGVCMVAISYFAIAEATKRRRATEQGRLQARTSTAVERSGSAEGAVAAWSFLSDSSTASSPSDWGGRRRPLLRSAVFLLVALTAQAFGARGLMHLSTLLGAGSLLVALALPSRARDAVERLLEHVSFAVASTAGFVLMAFAFAFVFLPFAVVVRAGGRDRLALRSDRFKASYWSARAPASSPEKLF